MVGIYSRYNKAKSIEIWHGMRQDKVKRFATTALIVSMLIVPFSGCGGPSPRYDLTVKTEPAELCMVYIDDISFGNVPVTLSLDSGMHQVYLLIAPGEWGLGTWEDGSAENPREIDVQSDKTITMRLVHLWELVEVPINLRGAKNLGSLHVELVYDPAVLEAASTEAGWIGNEWLGNIARSEVNLETPGRVIIEMTKKEWAGGINGDGSLIRVAFHVLAEEGTSHFSLENVEAHDATTGAEIPTRVSPGNFVVEDHLLTAPTITFTY